MDADRLLPDRAAVLAALGPGARLEPSRPGNAAQARGDVLNAVARASAYRSFTGSIEGQEHDHPIAVGMMGLVFDQATTAARTFSVVAGAAHLRIGLGDCQVAVETVTAPSGLVSYWGYVQHDRAIVVVTLDTLDPQIVSMTSFRALVSAVADQLERLPA